MANFNHCHQGSSCYFCVFEDVRMRGMVGTARGEFNCCLKYLLKDYTMIHPEIKFMKNAERATE